MKRTQLWMALGMMGLLVGLSACSPSKETAPKPSAPKVNTAKTVNFAKPATGTTVWFQTAGKTADPAKPTEGDQVTAIFVAENGKTTAYRVQDADVTVAQVAKMSPKAAAKFAKAQDKAYFAAAENAVSASVAGQPAGGNQQADLAANASMQKLLDGGNDLYFTFTFDNEVANSNPARLTNMAVVAPASYYKFKSGATDNHLFHTSGKVELQTLYQYAATDGKTGPQVARQTIGEGLLATVKKAKYKAPTAQAMKVTAKNGVRYQRVANFNAGEFETALYAAVKDDPVTVAMLTDYKNDGFITRDKAAMAANTKSVLAASRMATATKGVVGNFTVPTTLKLAQPLEQEVGAKRSIGYSLDGGGFLLTVAQTKTQRAVLPK